jgi:hypothetical protein
MAVSSIPTAAGAARPHQLFTPLAFATALLALTGCAAGLPSGAAAPAAAPAIVQEGIESLSSYSPVGGEAAAVATEEPEVAPRVIVATQSARANVRSGPATTFDIVAKANPNEAFDVIGKSEDERWWQVVISLDANGNPAQTGWISADVVRLAGEGDVAVTSTSIPLLDEKLAATWDVDWSCNSERCEIKECAATVTAAVNRPIYAWTFEVDRFTGQEKSGDAATNFLYSYWLGAKPGDANGVFPLTENEGVAVYCSGPHNVEIEEGGGWTTVYEGNTCHDVKTGMLVYLTYTKRWLFTGDYEGKSYERAYFGDSEKLEQTLAGTTAAVELLTRK